MRFLKPRQMLSRPLLENEKMPSSPWYKKLRICASTFTSAIRNRIIASMIAASAPSSPSKNEPKSKPPPPPLPLGMVSLELQDRADRAEVIRALLRLHVHVLR